MLDTVFQVIFACLVVAELGVVALIVLRLWQQSRGIAAPVPVRASDALEVAASFAVAMLLSRWISQGWTSVDLGSLLLFAAVTGLVGGAIDLWLGCRGPRWSHHLVEVGAVALGVLGGLSGVT